MKSLNSIRIKIAFWAGLCLVFLAIAMIVYSALTLRDREIRLAKEEATALAVAQARKVENRLGNAMSTAHALAQALSAAKEANEPLSRSQVSGYLKQLLIDNPDLLNTYTSWAPGAFDSTIDPKYGDWFWAWWTRQGGNAVQVTENSDFATDSSYDYYACPKNTKADCLIDPYLYNDPTTQKDMWLASVASPIIVKGTVVGIVTIDIQVDFFQAWVDGIDVEMGEGAVISYKGNLLGVSRNPKLFGQSLKELHPNDGDEYLATVQQGKAVIYERNGLISVFEPIRVVNSTPWSFNLNIPEKRVTDAVTASLLQMILVGVALTLAALALMVFITGSAVAAPIVKLNQAASRIAAGNLNVKVTNTSKDELGQMAAAFNHMVAYLQEMAGVAAQMADGNLTNDVQPQSDEDALGNAFHKMILNLRGLVGSVAQNARELDGASSQLSTAAGQASRATSQIAATIQQVAKGITTETESVSKTANSVEEMSRSIDGVAKGAQEQAKSVNQVVQQMNALSDAVVGIKHGAAEQTRVVDETQ
ncbi:MAG TPA: HAMP domain-containing protein, partial [Anaerolineaceae bacterium]|nr:HAMP domain-containing protein [Anaerolineaceae bacterium]